MFDSGPPPPPTTDFFGMVVNSGSDSKFILPLKYGNGTAHHELTIWWGDGTAQKTTGNAGMTGTYQGLTHDYPNANTNYPIKITGTTYTEIREGTYYSYFGIGFYNASSGYNVSTNKVKVKALLGSPDFLISPNMISKDNCYRYMFYGCTGLTEIPADLLPATTLASSCYSTMFYGCTGLKEIPADLLPATTLASYCYSDMFYGCTGLTEIPADLLPATTLASSCYSTMFCSCTGLKTIYMVVDWFSKTPKQASMFFNCTKITANTPYADIPTGWK
jgi:hypothetical protein